MSGAIRLSFSSAARMRRPTTTGRKARTTCSTSGSSGMDPTNFAAKKHKNHKASYGNHLWFLCLLWLLIAVDDLLDLVFDSVDETVFVRFDVQSQQRLRVRRANVKAPFGRIQRETIGEVFGSFLTILVAHGRDHLLDVFNLVI